MSTFQNLPGFRDFYPADCAARNYLFTRWRQVAARCGFVEYEGPVLEPVDLYKRKSGDEIVKQLFHFTDGGDRGVALRPETTPTLARMAAARQRDFRKPMKWFQIGSCFRYETPQKGRGREFYQFNCDILGEPSPAADAELLAVAVETMRALGFRTEDYIIRLSDRNVWAAFLEQEKVDAAQLPAFLQVIDKMEREKEPVTAAKLEALGTSTAAVQAFIAGKAAGYAPLAAVMDDLRARGMGDSAEIDPGIVRGLAYYTGIVFEIFDRSRSMRAVAGGGRYDNLCALIGGTDLPACGFAMGDMVIGNFIRETPHAQALLDSWVKEQSALDAYIVIASEAQRPRALAGLAALRGAGYSADYAMTPAKVAKQFQSAELLNARTAVVFGDEFPALQVKNLATRTAETVDVADLVAAVASARSAP